MRKAGSVLLRILLVAGVAIPVMGCDYRRHGPSNVGAAKAQLSMLEDAVRAYDIDVGTPPGNLTALIVRPTALATEGWEGPYLEKNTLPTDPWGNVFGYALTSEESGSIWSIGPDMVNGTTDDIVIEVSFIHRES